MPQSNWTTTCFGKIGSFIVLNKDGWIATCQHIATEIGNAIQSEARAKAIEAQKAAINADGALSNKEKQKQINAIGNLRNNEIDRVAVTWGVNLTTRLQVPQYHGVPVVDLAIGKLDKFDPTWVAEYPVLKDPAKDFEPGVNLCKLGYPFHDIAPAWDAAKDVFELPKEAFPIPQFIIDGILTRLINVVAPNMAAPPPFPMQLFETSTPGLQGQSGGPVFDKNGTVWGIQSHTAHYPLGFNPPVPKSSKGEKEYQFLNVGRCVHTSSIIGLLKQVGVQHDVSAY